MDDKIFYLLLRGAEDYHDEDEWIGIYDNIAALERAYNLEFQNLADEKKIRKERGMVVPDYQIMINSYNETAGEWNYNLTPEEIFGE